MQSSLRYSYLNPSALSEIMQQSSSEHRLSDPAANINKIPALRHPTVSFLDDIEELSEGLKNNLPVGKGARDVTLTFPLSTTYLLTVIDLVTAIDAVIHTHLKSVVVVS